MAGKTALVTGSSTGIGYETSLALARHGYRTYAGMRDVSKGQKLLAEATGLPLEAISIDVNDDSSVEAAVTGILAGSGRIDVLVNNAGYGQFGCTEDVSLDEFRAQFETNFFSIVRMIQKVVPVMRKQGSGTIVNVSSVVGRIGLPGSSAYISTKFALEGLSECLRYELRRFGINTTIIEPGVTKTKFFDSMRIPESNTDREYKKMTDKILADLKIMVSMGTEPSQVANVIIGAIHDEVILPRYTAGTDAAMFVEARKAKTDIEFERYISSELFSD